MVRGRVSIAPVVGALLAGLLVRCQTPVLPTPSPESTAMLDSLRLDATLSIQEGELVLSYDVRNRATRDVYLLNRLYRTTPAWDMSPDVIYVHLDWKAERVRLEKKLADLPDGVLVNSPVAPYVTPLRAQETFREEVHLPLPLQEYREYSHTVPVPPEAEHEVRLFHAVQLTVGYYWRPDGTREETLDVEGTEVILPRTPPGESLEFGLLHTDWLSVDIPVERIVPE